jgi:hypothetical protein
LLIDAKFSDFIEKQEAAIGRPQQANLRAERKIETDRGRNYRSRIQPGGFLASVGSSDERSVGGKYGERTITS